MTCPDGRGLLFTAQDAVRMLRETGIAVRVIGERAASVRARARLQ